MHVLIEFLTLQTSQNAIYTEISSSAYCQ